MPTADSEWRAVTEDFRAFWKAFKQSTSVNINSVQLKLALQSVVQRYFRTARPELLRIGFTQVELATLDEPLQELLRLADGNNARSSYKKSLTRVRAALPTIGGKLELLLGASQVARVSPERSATEAQMILITLRKMLPSAALSYEQALADLNDSTRVSFRGPALELREVLREVLDQLAPDDAVMGSDGFKLEKDRTKPTQRQKVRFILKARGRTQAAISTPEDAAATVERGVADLTRSVYAQGSLSTHIATSRREVVQLKRYVEAILSDILEL
jgi:hypothetical protein